MSYIYILNDNTMNQRVLIPTALNKDTFNAIELGVAKGEFSRQLLEQYPNMFLFSVDAWAGDRGHDENEYIATSKKLFQFKERNSIVRTFFENAAELFPINYFDFVYIDGYAHTGQHEGDTLSDWWSKVKPGGIMAGHDYDKRYQKTIDAVDKFCNIKSLSLHVVEEQPFPSWYVIKGV